MSNETLPQTENSINPSKVSEPAVSGVLSMSGIEKLIGIRAAALKELEGLVSRKMLFVVEEKLEKEKAELVKLLEWQTGKKAAASKYTLVLDPGVFEQRFFTT